MAQQVQLKNKDGKVYPNPFWPIGSIYISISSTNPSTYFGGTWEQFGQGKTLVGVNTSEAEFNTVQKTGGSKTVALTTTQIPSHSHSFSATTSTKSLTGQADFRDTTHTDHNLIMTTTSGVLSRKYTLWSGTHGAVQNANKSNYYTNELHIDASHNHTVSGTSGSSGGGGSHTNLQPYITVYFWRRTA